ncbi:uncharacterized protein B0H18DRAFT_1057635 [Fomitopsis serialis]|uniref:uncharacterized protein n=1 Tax=Fomitopsis serialis TaxID=139415 RepID=UPI0020088BFB|nr:uncharacterized protein B0H18DRAFT_1057635 [Neoantrodia serialis]KAH9911873.1 hypothetical protein B0H18DRAFT_1057635 [Neoantrodia serialis]
MRSRPTTVALSFVPGISLLDNLVTLSHLDLLRDVHTVKLYSLPEPSRHRDLAVEHFALGQLGQLPAVREARLCEPLPLFHIFPNMQTLCASNELSQLTPQKWMWPASVPLVDVSIDFEDLVHFTRAPIRRLYLYEYSSPDHTLDQLASTLQSARPICLSFVFYEVGRMENDPLRNWAGVFQTILCSQGHLRYLEATFDCTYVHGDNSLSPWMAEWFLPVIAQSNGDSSLLCMRLNFRVMVNRLTHARVPSLSHSTLQDAAQRVARHVPSVKFICIAMEPDYPEDQHLESITNEAGERLEHYMRSADFERKLSLDGFSLTGA